MPDLVHQLGELFLRAVPVAIIILIFYAVMRVLFFQPLLKVMAERDARTRGAQKEAEAAEAGAREKERQYQEAFKQAHAKVYGEQEVERKKVLDERAAFLKDARSKADAEVNAAKERVAGEFAAAKKEIEVTSAQLATEIARRVLQAPPGPGAPGKGAQ
ncbi:MAG TPA: ATP synthase F0 subunit B [Terriglobales bacterium]|nr:ATP synthase F0 subunit B [Terriglobales bacterium]